MDTTHKKVIKSKREKIFSLQWKKGFQKFDCREVVEELKLQGKGKKRKGENP